MSDEKSRTDFGPQWSVVASNKLVHPRAATQNKGGVGIILPAVRNANRAKVVKGEQFWEVRRSMKLPFRLDLTGSGTAMGLLDQLKAV